MVSDGAGPIGGLRSHLFASAAVAVWLVPDPAALESVFRLEGELVEGSCVKALSYDSVGG